MLVPLLAVGFRRSSSSNSPLAQLYESQNEITADKPQPHARVAPVAAAAAAAAAAEAGEAAAPTPKAAAAAARHQPSQGSPLSAHVTHALWWPL